MDTHDAHSIVMIYDEELGASSQKIQSTYCLVFVLPHTHTILNNSKYLGITTVFNNLLIKLHVIAL